MQLGRKKFGNDFCWKSFIDSNYFNGQQIWKTFWTVLAVELFSRKGGRLESAQLSTNLAIVLCTRTCLSYFSIEPSYTFTKELHGPCSRKKWHFGRSSHVGAMDIYKVSIPSSPQVTLKARSDLRKTHAFTQ